MDYEFYIQRLVTENIVVKASSVYQAMDILAEKVSADPSPVVRLAGIGDDGKVYYRLLPDLHWDMIKITERGVDNRPQELSRQLHLQIVKSIALLRKVAEFQTTEDIAIDQEVTELEAYSSRDFEDEYCVLMEVIRKARAALDVPDYNLNPGE